MPPPPPCPAPRLALQVEGYGCVLVTSQAKAASAGLSRYLGVMRAFTAQGPLNSFSKEFQFLQQKMLPHPRTPRTPAVAPVAPPGMVAIPAAARGFDYDVTAQIDQGADSQLYWENPQVTSPDPDSPAANAWKLHSMRLPVEGFLMDRHPVTTAEYGAYLRSSQYTPLDAYNFLLNWNGSRPFPP
jgi:iron(II)-dependent oxidoreductase